MAAEDPMTPRQSEFDRGRESGATAAQLDEFRRHFVDLNGSIVKTGLALQHLAAEIATLRAEAKAAEARVSIKESTLADETERRRTEVADQTEARRASLAVVAEGSDRFWTRGSIIATAALGLAGLLLTAALLLL